MSVHTQFRWFLAGLLVMVLVSGPASRADTLVTKDGKQWQGRIVDEGESYTLIQPDGSKLSFPKDVVQEVISPEIKRPEYEAMLKEADLSDDEQVAKLAEFAAQYGLTEEQKKLLASAYSLRRAATEDESGAQRGLAAWCESFGLEEEAVAAELRADQLEFAGKLAGAGDDPDRLVELARWCKERGMTAELQRCLSQAYSERKREASTAQAHWELAQWCGEWQVAEWMAEQQRAAVEAAASEKDVVQLQAFLDYLEKGAGPSDVRAVCARAIHGLRLASVGTDALAYARLSAWSRKHGLEQEADEAEAAALRIAPEDEAVRKELRYLKDPLSGGWVKPSQSTALIQAFARVREEPGTLLITSVPLGVDVCIDDSPPDRLGLPPRTPTASASEDPRYVGRTPVVVPMPKEKVKIIFCYYGDLDDVRHGGGMLLRLRDPSPGDYRYHLIFTFFAEGLPRGPGERPWVMRSVNVLLQAEEPETSFVGSDQYAWPTKPCFTEWQADSGTSVKNEWASLGVPEGDMDRAMTELVSRGATAVHTPKGSFTYMLVLGEDGTVHYHMKQGPADESQRRQPPPEEHRARELEHGFGLEEDRLAEETRRARELEERRTEERRARELEQRRRQELEERRIRQPGPRR